MSKRKFYKARASNCAADRWATKLPIREVEHIRSYQVYQANEKILTPSYAIVAVAALMAGTALNKQATE